MSRKKPIDPRRNALVEKIDQVAVAGDRWERRLIRAFNAWMKARRAWGRARAALQRYDAAAEKEAS